MDYNGKMSVSAGKKVINTSLLKLYNEFDISSMKQKVLETLQNQTLCLPISDPTIRI
jgi:hypothetical protein